MNIILDIGNVICEWDPQKLVASAFTDKEEQEDALEYILHHEDWVDLDRGTIELEAAIHNAIVRSNLDPKRIEALYHAVPLYLKPIPEMLEAIERAAEASVPLYVLSNMHKYSWEYLAENYSFWKKFTGIVLSWEIHCIKPEQAIYTHIAETYKLVPEETYFLDDMPENIEAAQEFGIQAKLVSDPNLGAGILNKILESNQ